MNMDIFADKENESRDSQQTRNQSFHARTPLLDVKNKCAKTNLLQSESSQKLDALNLHALGTPGRKQSKVSRKIRSSCIPAFQLPYSEDLSGTDKIAPRTLPLMVEEEPDESFPIELLKKSDNTIPFKAGIVELVSDHTYSLSTELDVEEVHLDKLDQGIININISTAEESPNPNDNAVQIIIPNVKINLAKQFVDTLVVTASVHTDDESVTKLLTETPSKNNKLSNSTVSQSHSKIWEEDLSSVEVVIADEPSNGNCASEDIDLSSVEVVIADETSNSNCASGDINLSSEEVEIADETSNGHRTSEDIDLNSVEVVIADEPSNGNCASGDINLSSEEVEIADETSNGHRTSEDIDLNSVEVVIADEPSNGNCASGDINLSSEEVEIADETSNGHRASEDTDLNSVEVVITDEPSNGQQVSDFLSRGELQSCSFFDDTGTWDCAEVSSSALPSEQELNCSVIQDSMTVLIETMFPEFRGNTKEAETVYLASDHTYSLSTELDVQEVHLNKLDQGPANINISTAEESSLPSLYITTPRDKINLTEQIVDSQLVDSPVPALNEKYAHSLTEAHSENWDKYISSLSVEMTDEAAIEQPTCMDINIFTSEENSVPTDYPLHITIPCDGLDLTEQFVGSQLVNSPVHPDNESFTCLDMNRVESELMQLMVDSLTTYPPSTELSDSTVRHLLSVNLSPVADSGNLNSGPNMSLSLASFDFEQSEQADVLNDVSVSFTPNSPLSTELSDFNVHHLFSIDFSAFADCKDLNYEADASLSLASFVFEPLEQAGELNPDNPKSSPMLKAFDSEEPNVLPAHSYVAISCLGSSSDLLTPRAEADVNDQSMMAMPSVTETSMNTDSCLGLDISQNTDSITTLDHSMMANPDIVNKQTMTERKLLKDAESSMTPFKPSKMGKRLTTEDVRRQHPRTIANHLDTTTSTNQRLEKEIKLSLQEKDQLNAMLKETQTKLICAEKHLETEKLNQEKHIKMLEELHEEATAGLQKCLEEKQNAIYNLEQELVCLQQKYAEDKVKSAEAEAGNQRQLLESATLKAEQKFEEELQRMKNRYNESNYKRQFQASLRAIKELRSERDELLGLAKDIEFAFIQQEKFKDALDKLAQKIQTSAIFQMEEYNRLVSELKETQSKCCDAQNENKKLHNELENMDSLLNRNQNCFVEMEALYVKDREELAASKKLVLQYSEELTLTNEALYEASQSIEALTQQLDEVRKSDTTSGQALRAAEERIKVLESELMETEQILDVTSQSKSKKEKEYETTVSKLEKYINDLQQTLDTWEAEKERDEQELYECREQMFADRMKLEELTKELDALRKVKVTTQADKEKITELKTTNRLLEEEKQLCMDAISDYRHKLEDEVQLNTSNQQLIEALRRSNENLLESYNQLMSEMQIVEASLSERNSDIDSSRFCLQHLEEKMNTLLCHFQEKLGQEIKCDSSNKRQLPPHGMSCVNNGGDSFVALVLARASQTLTVSTPEKLNSSQASLAAHSCSGHKRRQTNVPLGSLHPDTARPQSTGSFSLSPGNKKCPSLDMSGLELFSPNPRNLTAKESPKTSAPIDQLQDGCCSLVPGFASIRSIPSTSVRALEAKIANLNNATTSARMEQTYATLGYQPLLTEVQGVERLFNQIEKSFLMVERAAELVTDDLKFDMEMMSKKMQNVNVRESRLESELSKKTQMLNNANDKMKEMNAQIVGMNENLLRFQDQTIEISRLKEDKAELKLKVEDLNGQVRLLSEQLADLIKKLGSGSKKDGDFAQEILQLKKLNHELFMKLFSEKEKHKELGEKAMKRMKIFESNWKKAENEVHRFDELVEQIRQACINSQCQSTVPVVLHIVRLIDGLVDYEAPSKQPSGY